MISLDNEELNDVNLILEKLDAHDRFIEAKIELFEALDKKKETNNVNKKIVCNNIIKKNDPKNILSNIINILNYVFPDYEFKYLNHSNYKCIKNINNAIDNINYNLFYVIENIYRGFNKRIWRLLKELIDFKHCDVYTYLNETDNDPYLDIETLSSFNYFFFAKKNNKILFISCITKPKYKNHDEDFNNIFIDVQDDINLNNQEKNYDESSSNL